MSNPRFSRRNDRNMDNDWKHDRFEGRQTVSRPSPRPVVQSMFHIFIYVLHLILYRTSSKSVEVRCW